MAPSLLASYTSAQTRNNTVLSSGAFTASAGEVIVVKISNESGFNSPGLPTATGLTFTTRAQATSGTANDCFAGLYTAVVPAGGGTYTVTAPASGASLSHSFVVERWGNAQLAATPAITQVTGNTTSSATITTTAANSVVSWASADWNAVTYTTRTYRSSATEEFVTGTAGSDYFAAYAYQSAATAGSQTFGMTQPTGQKDSMVAIEILDGGVTGATYTSDLSESVGATDSVQADIFQTSTATLYGTGATTGGAATWTNAANANGAPDATVATWTNATSGATGTLDLSFDFSSLVPSNATIVSVAITVRSAIANATRMQAPTAQVFIGGSAVGSAATLSSALTLTDTTFNPTLTTAQVIDPTFDVRFTARKAAANAQSSTTTLDGVTVVVNYTAPSANYTSSPGDNAGISDVVSTTMSGQITSSPADSVGLTDAVAAVKAVRTSLSDAASGSDTASVVGVGNASSNPSESVGLTDSVSAVLTTGGGGSSVNIELLAAVALTGNTTHTVTLSKGPTLNTLYCIATSHGLMTIDGGTGGWVEVSSLVNNIDYKIWRLDSPSSSKTSITITHATAVELSAIVFQAHVDGTGTPYFSPRQFDLTNRIGQTTIGTGLHTYSGETTSFAIYNTCGNSGVLSSAMDLTAFDLGFSDFADTGLATSSLGDSRVWLAINESSSSLSNNGVTATVSGTTWNTGVDGFGGMFSLKLLAAPGGAPQNYTSNISDSAGATDALTPNFNGSIPVIETESVGVTDSVTATKTSPVNTNLEMLAQYSNGATGATSHTINFSHAPSLNTLYLVAISAGMMTVDGGTGGWVNVSSRVNSTDQKIWRLDNPSTSKTSITITTTNAVSVAAVVFQANVDTNVSPYINPIFNPLNARIGQSSIGTGLHTYSGQTASIAYFSINGNSGGISTSQDLTSYDLGFSTLGKTGLAQSTFGDVGLWLAVNKNTGSLNNAGVSATTAVSWDCGDDSFGGMLALNLLPVSGGGPQDLGDSAGITDSLSVLVNGNQASLTIYQENYNPVGGQVQSDTFWLQGVTQTAVPGFARSTYYLPGQTAQFSVGYNTAFNVEIWRMGAYPSQTHGAHKIATVAGTGATQPSPTTIPNSNGAVDYSNWSVNATWNIPGDVTPGWYYALFRGQAVTSDLGFYLFCVSDKNAKKPLLVVSSDSTYIGAYNTYGPGNKSLYGSGGPIGGTGGITDRALAGSLNRPVDTRLSVPQTFWMNSEMPFLRFLERFGYEAGHATNEQVENDPSVLDGRTAIVFIGHNEYISQTLWDKVADLQANTSVNIINLAANDFFWKVRYGTTDSTDKATKGRVIWCHKDTVAGPGTHVAGTQLDPLEWLGTWQDTRWSGRRVIANLFADIFKANGIRADEITVPASMKSLPLWRNCTRVQALTTGQSLGLGVGNLGMEWDGVATVGAPLTTQLTDTSVAITAGVSDANGETYGNSETVHHAFQIMRNAGGGYTFNASTTQWSWSLDDFHDRGTLVANADAQQATINLLADFGIMPIASTITAASLTYPTPVSNVGTAYAIPANTGTNYTNAPADSAGATDSVSVTRDYVISIGDSAGVTDATQASIADIVTIGDSAGITDSVIGWTEYLKTAGDSAGITDAVTAIQSFVETQDDAASITDSVSVFFQGQISQSPSDIANGTDTATADLQRLFTQGTNEVINATDSVTVDQARVMAVSLSESIGATETWVLLDEELFADNAGITDTTSIVKAVNAALTDTAGGSDAASSSFQGNATQNLSDNAGISDLLTLLKAITKANADTANLSDAIASVRSIIKTLSDSVGVTDSVSATKNAQANFKVWTGSTEAPLTIDGWWSGTSVVPMTYDQMT